MHYMSNASGIEKERDLVMFGERISMLNNKSDRANKFAEVSAHAIYLESIAILALMWHWCQPATTSSGHIWSPA